MVAEAATAPTTERRVSDGERLSRLEADSHHRATKADVTNEVRASEDRLRDALRDAVRESESRIEQAVKNAVTAAERRLDNANAGRFKWYLTLAGIIITMLTAIIGTIIALVTWFFNTVPLA